MSRTTEKKGRTISWGQWCEELGVATDVDTTGLLGQDTDLLMIADDPEDPEYDDPYEEYDPTMRSKPTSRVRNTTPPLGKPDPELQRAQTSHDTGLRGERDAKYRGRQDDNDDGAREREERLEERLRPEMEQLQQVIADLTRRVIKVRDEGPPGLAGLEALGQAYRDLDSRSGDIETMGANRLKTLRQQADRLATRADDWEGLFKQYSQAGDLLMWARERGPTDFNAALTKQMLDAEQQAMSDALEAQPVDAQAYGDACTQLQQLKTVWEGAEAARRNFNDASVKLQADLTTCLKNGTKNEVRDLEAAVREIEQVCQPNTQQAFEQAIKTLPGFAVLIAKCLKAHLLRLEIKVDCEERFVACRQQFKVARDNLVGEEHRDFKRKSKDGFDGLLNEIKDLLSVESGGFDANKTNNALSRMEHIVESAQVRFDEMQEKLARRDRDKNADTDRKEFAEFKYNDATTWVLQPVSWGKVPQASVDVTDADHGMVRRITAGDLGDGSGVQTGRAYHCHMLDGSGGISFAYNHLGGRRVQPVVYDYAVKRHENNSGGGGKYDWLLGGGKKNPASAKLPKTVRPSRSPDSKD